MHRVIRFNVQKILLKNVLLILKFKKVKNNIYIS